MSILLALVPISLVLLGIAILAFIWAVRGGQFDDLDTPSIDILADGQSEGDGDNDGGETDPRQDADRGDGTG